MPSFDLVPPELRRVERYYPDLLVLELCQGQRPFSGLLEQVDWRLCGLISRWVERGRVTGEVGERVLLHPGRHLRCDHVLVMGIGPADQLNSLICNRALEEIMEVCDGLQTQVVALPLPGRASGQVKPEVAAQFLTIRVGKRPLRVVAVEEEHLHADISATLA
jgi:hypothetical protein